MAMNVTDQRGYFYVSGNESEWSAIDPVLIVRHKCNDGGIVIFLLFIYFKFLKSPVASLITLLPMVTIHWHGY